MQKDFLMRTVSAKVAERNEKFTVFAISKRNCWCGLKSARDRWLLGDTEHAVEEEINLAAQDSGFYESLSEVLS